MLQKLINPKNLIIVSIFGLLLFLMVSCGKSRNESRTNSSYQSTTPSFTCKNCGNHSFHYHETIKDMKVCNSCKIGQ